MFNYNLIANVAKKLQNTTAEDKRRPTTGAMLPKLHVVVLWVAHVHERMRTRVVLEVANGAVSNVETVSISL